MKSRNVFLASGVLVASIAVAVPSSQATPTAHNSHRVRYEGTWMGTTSLGVHSIETATSLDPNNDRVAMVFTATTDPTFGGQFPTADRISNFHGEAVRSGPRTFNFMKVAVGSDASGAVVYFL